MDLIVEDCVILPMAGSNPTAAAMLIRDGKIVVVGTVENARSAALPGARVVRLAGATVIPGLIDAHCHVSTV